MRFGVAVLAVIVVAASCGETVTDSTTTSTMLRTTTITEPVAPSSTTGSTAQTTATTTGNGPASEPCDPSAILQAADAAIEAGRLAPGNTWSTEPTTSSFLERTTSATGFASQLALNCAILAEQQAPDRLLLAAWTGPRTAFVIQAADAPSIPYDEAVRFDLLSEQPWGEWLEENLWAVSLEDGTSLILGADDYSLGAIAKAWQAAYPEPPPAEPEIDAERYAIAALEAAGARNVGIAEPTDTDIASIAFMTRLGNVLIATVGPVESLDTQTPYLSGETRIQTVDSVDVRITLPGPDDLDTVDIAFRCGTYSWRIGGGFGTSDEALQFVVDLIDSLDC